MQILHNIQLRNIIFEEIERFVDEQPEKVQQMMRRNVEKHLRAYIFLKRLLNQVDNIRQINKNVQNEFANMANAFKRSNTPEFFHQILKADLTKINAINKIFSVVKNIGNVEMRDAQMSLEKAKTSVDDLIELGKEKIGNYDQPHIHKSTANDDKETVAGQSIAAEEMNNGSNMIKPVLSKVEDFSKYLKSRMHSLMNAGSDEDSKNMLEKEITSLQASLKGFSELLTRHVGSQVSQENKPLEQPMAETIDDR